MSISARLEAREVTAGYGKQPVLEQVSAAVSAGEFVGLIGPNGSGKSTLLRVLSGTLPLSGGLVLLDGVSITTLRRRDVARRIAFVPQSEPAVFDFTVRDMVLMGRSPWIGPLGGETGEDFRAAERAMAAADLLALAERPVTSLSGGERQRVLLARALAQSAPILLLDEPTAHLDLGHQADTLAHARRLADDGAAVVAALHDLNLAADYCDRLVLLADRRVAADAPPAEALTAERLSAAYGTPVRVGRSPATGGPFVFPAALRPGREAAALAVHVVCGGGSGAAVLCALVRRGYTVTAGVLNRLDSDDNAAEALGIERALEAPFSPIGAEARGAGAALMARANAVVVAEAPIGHGNLANLELASDARAGGKPVLLIGGSPIERRDFTAGRATRLWEALVREGATVVPNLAELERALARIAESAARSNPPSAGDAADSMAVRHA